MSSFSQRECLGCGQPCDGLYCYLCTCQQCRVSLTNGICLNCTYRDGKPLTCCECKGPLRGGFCWFCDSKAETSFAYDPNPNSFDYSQNLSDYPPQPQYETYLRELCGNDSHYGYDCPPCDELMNELFKDVQSMFEDYHQREQAANLSTHPPEPSRRFNYICYDDDDDYDYEERTVPLNEIISQIPSSIVITTSLPVLPTEDLKDSLIIVNEDLSTISKNESFEFIKSSVEDLVPVPSESEDTSESDSECNLLSDDELLFDEDVPDDNFKIYSNPLFEFDDEYISSDVNLIFDEVLENTESKDSYDSNLDEPYLLVTPLFYANKDECFDSGCDDDEINVLECEDSYYDSEGDILYLESLLNDDVVHRDPSISAMSVAFILEGFTDEPHLEENDDLFDLESKNDEWKKIFHYIFFTYVVQILLLYFTYPVVSPFLLSSESEDTIFDPGISAFHFSHRSGTFISFDVYPNILNESPMEICSSTCFTPNITMIWEIPSGEIKVHIEVLSVLWGNRLPIQTVRCRCLGSARIPMFQSFKGRRVSSGIGFPLLRTLKSLYACLDAILTVNCASKLVGLPTWHFKEVWEEDKGLLQAKKEKKNHVLRLGGLGRKDCKQCTVYSCLNRDRKRRCSKHMTGNRALLTNFMEKFLGTVRFGNNDFTVIAGYGDVVIGSMIIKKVYYVEGLGHNLFSVGQFCYKGLEVAFRKSMHVESINGKRFVLVVVDDYSRYAWVLFLHSEDEASEVIISFIKKTQVNLQLQVQRVRTDNGTDFKNKTLAKFFDEVGITQQFYAVRTPQQNGVVERRNRTLVEATRTMHTFANLPLFLWAEAIATACFTQNHSIIHKGFDKTPYELMNKRKRNIKFFRVFRCRYDLLNDYEDVGKHKAKKDIGVFVGYSKESAAFRIYNKRTRKIHESVNVNFDEILEMASKQFSLEFDLSNLNKTRKSSNPSVSQVSETSKKDLKDLFQNFYDEYFDSSKIMKSSTTNVETSNV
nr:retrovirus-related Pol polyprotein from transposon TNT 1-94 [Tanacetum cinerariifolium]